MPQDKTILARGKVARKSICIIGGVEDFSTSVIAVQTNSKQSHLAFGRQKGVPKEDRLSTLSKHYVR
jgi:hypothetical protein